ncbi:protein PAM68, chloroplastic [Humulus lupulus]|uniref:protein PAM68, chloroplastic n=1 Tax=Humulus lupulus TaxID=3486 RepID=UPI002B403919|nr:protein PAM68, chloroplastic [Humulus lupulus]
MAATAVTFSWLSPIPNFNPTSSHKVSFKILALPATNCLIKGLTANQYPISTTKTCKRKDQTRLSHFTPMYATLKSPKGFGPPKKSNKTSKKTTKDDDDDEDNKRDEEEEGEEADEGVIPEIVTNRMISRMGFTVGAPLFVGLLFFPFFYYLKVGLKIDVPTWVPFIVSFIFFGTALLGVSYGIVSSSWDPLREGSLLGWNEAKKNWPVFWQSFWGGSKRT